MRNIIFILITIILGVILIVPIFMGTMLEKDVKSQIAYVAGSSKTKIKLDQYRREWFSSHAKVELQVPVPRWVKKGLSTKIKLPNRLKYIANLTIYHGPVAMARDLSGRMDLFWGRGVVVGTISLVSPSSNNFPKLSGLNKPIHFMASIDMNGQAHAYMLIPGIKYLDLKNRVLAGFKSALIHASYTVGSPKVNVDMSLHGVDFVTSKFRLTIPVIVNRSSVTSRINGLWLGKQNFTIPEVFAYKAGKLYALIRHITFGATNVDSGSRIKFDHYANINSMQYKQYKVGPLVFASQINMNKPKLLAFLTYLKSNQFRSVAKDKQFETIKPYLLSLLKGATYNLTKLSLNTPNGILQAKGSLSIPEAIAANAKGKSNLDKLIYSQTGKLTLMASKSFENVKPVVAQGPGPVGVKFPKTPEKLYQALAGVLTQAKSSGLLTDSGDNLVANFVYKNGVLSLNGKRIFPTKRMKTKPVQNDQNAQASSDQASMPTEAVSKVTSTQTDSTVAQASSQAAASPIGASPASVGQQPAAANDDTVAGDQANQKQAQQ